MSTPKPPAGDGPTEHLPRGHDAPPLAANADTNADTLLPTSAPARGSRPSVAPPPPRSPQNSPGAETGEETLQRPAEEPGPSNGVKEISPAAAPRAAAVVAGYEIVGELGRGGMGVVYKARQVRPHRLVALKMILAGVHAGREQLARFQNEAEAVAGLQHPNIVQVYEVGEQEGRPFFSMEFVQGDGLDRRLGGTPQPSRAAAELVEALARAVHYAHAHGIVHRDLKPANVLLAPPPSASRRAEDGASDSAEQLYGVPKISDFGLAKRLDGEGGQTRSGDVLGTPSYMAPEQALGKIKEVGPLVDVWALGAILYELLTGRPPFKAATPVDTLWQVINEEPVPPGRLRPRLPRDLETICLKCLQKDPGKRYASAQELANDLRRHLAGEAVQARPPGRGERLWRWCRRNPVPASLLVAVTFGSGLGLGHLCGLSESLVRSSALESAAQQSETFDELNTYYSRVAANLKAKGVKTTHDWMARAGEAPFPATFTIDLGNQISAKSVSGVHIRLYSDYPFRWRKERDGGVRDEFEKTAIKQLRQDPDRPFYRFEDYQGRPVLRYATARRMEASCLYCHNDPEQTTKQGWKVGDVRGVLEIIRPLDRDAERIQQGLRGTFLLVAGVAGGLLLLCALVVLISRRRRRAGATLAGSSL